MSTDGDGVVVLETDCLNAVFPWTLTEPGTTVLGPHPINDTGPYVFQEAGPDQLYRVAANLDYRHGTPGFEEVRVMGIPDQGAFALAFEAGAGWAADIDPVYNPALAEAGEVKEGGNPAPCRSPRSGQFWLC